MYQYLIEPGLVGDRINEGLRRIASCKVGDWHPNGIGKVVLVLHLVIEAGLRGEAEMKIGAVECRVDAKDGDEHEEVCVAIGGSGTGADHPQGIGGPIESDSYEISRGIKQWEVVVAFPRRQRDVEGTEEVGYLCRSTPTARDLAKRAGRGAAAGCQAGVDVVVAGGIMPGVVGPRTGAEITNAVIGATSPIVRSTNEIAVGFGVHAGGTVDEFATEVYLMGIDVGIGGQTGIGIGLGVVDEMAAGEIKVLGFPCVICCAESIERIGGRGDVTMNISNGDSDSVSRIRCQRATDVPIVRCASKAEIRRGHAIERDDNVARRNTKAGGNVERKRVGGLEEARSVRKNTAHHRDSRAGITKRSLICFAVGIVDVDGKDNRRQLLHSDAGIGGQHSERGAVEGNGDGRCVSLRGIGNTHGNAISALQGDDRRFVVHRNQVDRAIAVGPEIGRDDSKRRLLDGLNSGCVGEDENIRVRGIMCDGAGDHIGQNNVGVALIRWLEAMVVPELQIVVGIGRGGITGVDLRPLATVTGKSGLEVGLAGRKIISAGAAKSAP